LLHLIILSLQIKTHFSTYVKTLLFKRLS